MASPKKNTMNWLCNQSEIIDLVNAIGARNITTIKAVFAIPAKEEFIAQYSDMIMHDSKEADTKALEWCKMIVEERSVPERYIYFRVIRY